MFECLCPPRARIDRRDTAGARDEMRARDRAMYPPVGEAGGASLPGCDYRLIDESMVVYVECALSSQRITGSLQFCSRSPRCKKELPPRTARIRARGEHRTGAALRLEPLDYSDLSVVPRAVGARGLHTRGRGGSTGGQRYIVWVFCTVFGTVINNYFRDSHDGGVGILCRARRFVTDLLSSSVNRRLRRGAWRKRTHYGTVAGPGYTRYNAIGNL